MLCLFVLLHLVEGFCEEEAKEFVLFFAMFEEVDDVLVGAVLVFDLVCFEPEAFFRWDGGPQRSGLGSGPCRRLLAAGWPGRCFQAKAASST